MRMTRKAFHATATVRSTEPSAHSLSTDAALTLADLQPNWPTTYARLYNEQIIISQTDQSVRLYSASSTVH